MDCPGSLGRTGVEEAAVVFLLCSLIQVVILGGCADHYNGLGYNTCVKGYGQHFNVSFEGGEGKGLDL